MNGQMTITGVKFDYEVVEIEPNYDRIIFDGVDTDIFFEIENNQGRIDLYFIERGDELSNTFFDENWEDIFEQVKREL